MNIIEYLDARNIKWIPVIYHNKRDVRLPIDFHYINSLDGRLMRAFNTFMFLNDDEIKQLKESAFDTEHILIDTMVQHQIDIDRPCPLMDYFYKENAPYFLSSNKRLPHFFVNFPKPENMSYAGQFDGGDYLSGLASCCRRDEMVYKADQPIPIFNFI